mgnify:CR=1 FL=1
MKLHLKLTLALLGGLLLIIFASQWFQQSRNAAALAVLGAIGPTRYVIWVDVRNEWQPLAAALFCTMGLAPESGASIAVVTTFALASLAPAETSSVVRERVDAARRLRAAGALIVGTANLHELAYGVTSANAHFGAVGNPAAPGHVPGGSSGGSAAGRWASDPRCAAASRRKS